MSEQHVEGEGIVICSDPSQHPAHHYSPFSYGKDVWCPGKPNARFASIVSPDAATHTNSKGGSQSLIPVRFDLIDGRALFAMAEVLDQGAEKYGANNWRKIDIEDHLNHLIMHAYAYLAGDRSDAHLSHIMCRSMFAQAVYFQEHPEEK